MRTILPVGGGQCLLIARAPYARRG
jgi:hypothetical protein